MSLIYNRRNLKRFIIASVVVTGLAATYKYYVKGEDDDEEEEVKEMLGEYRLLITTFLCETLLKRLQYLFLKTPSLF